MRVRRGGPVAVVGDTTAALDRIVTAIPGRGPGAWSPFPGGIHEVRP